MPITKTVFKPWGKELWLVHSDKYALKKLFITKDHRLSLQYHQVKEEDLYIEQGLVLCLLEQTEKIYGPGELIHIPINTVHRLTALENSIITEVSTPQLDDVVRLADDYNRNIEKAGE